MKKRTCILWTERAEFPQGWNIKEHYHSFYHLFYILEGNGTFVVDGKDKYAIYPKQCFLFAPGIKHELHPIEVPLMVAYEIKFNIPDEALNRRIKTVPLLSEGNDFYDTAVEYVVENGMAREPFYAANADSFLSSLLLYIGRNNFDPENINSELVDTSGLSQLTTGIIHYIDHHYAEKIYLANLANHLEYNANYMCAVFKKDTGLTIIDYLNYVRIRKACEYLSFSEIDIKKLSSRVGFSNTTHFDRTFKKLVGLPPMRYKELYPPDISTDKGTGKIANWQTEDLVTIQEAFVALRKD